jgi:transcription elongation factor Elf1
MSQRRYNAALKATAKAYEKGGVQAACNEAAKRGYNKMFMCLPCEAKQPVIEERIRNSEGKIITTCDCGVCGSRMQPLVVS